MRNRSFLVSALAGLFVALLAAPALAGPGAGSEEKVDSFTFLGMTFCASSAEEAERCEVRLEGENEQIATGPTNARSEREGVVSFFGYKICLGNAGEGANCDLRLPAQAPDSERDRHARL